MTRFEVRTKRAPLEGRASRRPDVRSRRNARSSRCGKRAPNARVKPPRNALIGSRGGYAHRSLARSPYCGVGLNDLLGARYAAEAYEATARSDVAWPLVAREALGRSGRRATTRARSPSPHDAYVVTVSRPAAEARCTPSATLHAPLDPRGGRRPVHSQVMRLPKRNTAPRAPNARVKPRRRRRLE